MSCPRINGSQFRVFEVVGVVFQSSWGWGSIEQPQGSYKSDTGFTDLSTKGGWFWKFLHLFHELLGTNCMFGESIDTL